MGLRIDRRRRILSEERHAWADASRGGSDCADLANARRYTDAANVENHPQISDFVPRRLRSYLSLAAASATLLAVLATLHFYATDLIETIAPQATSAVELASAEGLDRWVLSMVLIVAAMVAALVYSLRQHRVDDYRARYRVWLWVTALCMLASADAVCGLHRSFGAFMAGLTGFTALPDAAVWWLLPATGILTWIGLRLAPDLAECPPALTLLVLAVVALVAAALPLLGWRPLAADQLAAVASLTVLSAAILLTFALTLYARHVVLDVQGLIVMGAPRRKVAAKGGVSEAQSNAAAKIHAETGAAAAGDTSSPAVATTAKSQPSADQWVDGSAPESDPYDEDGAPHRRLSKAQRKRLRKQKLRRAA